jgi:hypothetical protein
MPPISVAEGRLHCLAFAVYRILAQVVADASILMRQLIGVGTPRGLQGRFVAVVSTLWR